MAEPTLALQTALLAAVKGVVTVDVWDAVPQDTAYPYITLDTMNVSNEDLLGGYRIDRRFVYLNIWSRAYGQAEIMTIMGQIDTLNETVITLSTGNMVSLRVDRKTTVREPDNLTFMGQVMLRIITTH